MTLQSPGAVTHHGHRLAAVSQSGPVGHVCRSLAGPPTSARMRRAPQGFFVHAMQTCKTCGQAKPLGEFYIRKDTGKHRTVCRACHRLKTDEWAENNRERRLAIALKYAKANYPKIRANKARYRAEDPLRMRRWALENPERMQAARDRWDAANKHRKTEHAAARRSRLRQAVPAWADRNAMAAVYREARMMTEQTGEPWEVDHIVPLAGKTVCGLHVEHNLRVIPVSENRKKGRSHWPDMP